MNKTNTNRNIPVKRDTLVDLYSGMMKMARDAGALKEFDRIADYDMSEAFSGEAKIPISSYEFRTSFVVDYGGSEGIYIDGFLDGILDESGRNQHWHFCTMKTLERNLEAMKIMGKTCGILQYYATEYVNRNLNRYEPDPAKVLAFHAEHVPHYCIHCGNIGCVSVETLPHNFGDLQKELYAFWCNICGAQTEYCATSLELREKLWDRGLYSIKNSDAILVRKGDLREICNRSRNQRCNRDCANCPLDVVREIRRIR